MELIVGFNLLSYFRCTLPEEVGHTSLSQRNANIDTLISIPSIQTARLVAIKSRGLFITADYLYHGTS